MVEPGRVEKKNTTRQLKGSYNDTLVESVSLEQTTGDILLGSLAD